VRPLGRQRGQGSVSVSSRQDTVAGAPTSRWVHSIGIPAPRLRGAFGEHSVLAIARSRRARVTIAVLLSDSRADRTAHDESFPGMKRPAEAGLSIIDMAPRVSRCNEPKMCCLLAGHG